MPSDLTPERRRFLEVLAGHPEGLAATEIPEDIDRTVRRWCQRKNLAQCIRFGKLPVRWRITEYGRAAIGDREARP